MQPGGRLGHCVVGCIINPTVSPRYVAEAISIRTSPNFLMIWRVHGSGRNSSKQKMSAQVSDDGLLYLSTRISSAAAKRGELPRCFYTPWPVQRGASTESGNSGGEFFLAWRQSGRNFFFFYLWESNYM